ncbi:MAG: SDR family NAD(P)-dependent oxidoreductase [Cyanobacteria bacterium SZAS-4]|nr:SDR family NAD(P)-dependent oxidoreductase [Cyanobacteria bacterium SZAS-4]
MNEKLKGLVVVITGASSGFGKGAARKYAEGGANLVLTARRGDLLDELVAECQNFGTNAISVPADVGIKNDIESVAQAAVSEFGRIDVWINNAGAAAIGNFAEVPIEDHVQVIQTDLIGAMRGSHLALKQFMTQGNVGILINVASMIGKVPAPYYASYTAAKFGVVGLDAALRQELKEQKIDSIKVCTVMPMAMDTSFFEHAANYTGKEAVPIPPLDDAQKVIDVLIDLATNPRDETPVGMGSGINTFLHNVAPALSEAMMGKITHSAQIENAPPAPPSPGNLRETTAQGSEVKDPKIAKK